MERVHLRPNTAEILIKSSKADGHSDIFSYESEAENHNGLGSLFVVSHVDSTGEDTAYLTNLIAALAKREYYANPGREPRAAFASALKKMNEVSEEFFQKQDLGLHVGVFAIAGDKMFISRLGKFKMLLAREDRILDVLNNVDLFDREQTEHQFTNIVSGQVSPHDRIFAFYPSRTIVAREKSLKTEFTKLDQASFVAHLNGIHQTKDTFGCTALHIDLAKVAEPVVAKPRRRKIALDPDGVLTPDPVSIPQPETVSLARASELGDSVADDTAVDVPVSTAPVMSSTPAVHTTPISPVINEVPRIIPSEFSLGRKDGSIRRFIARLGISELSPRVRGAVFLGSVTALAVIGIVVRNIIVPSDTDKAITQAIEQAHDTLKQAQNKISQNELPAARELLFGAIGQLNGIAERTDPVEQVEAQILSTLDSVDNAHDANPTRVTTLSADLGAARRISISTGALTVYAATTDDQTGNIIRVDGGSVASTTILENFSPKLLNTSTTTATLLETANNRIAVLKGNTIKSITVQNPKDWHDGVLYQNNLYLLSSTGIEKITDVDQSKGSTSAWLQGSTLPSDAYQLGIDGSIYVLSRQGHLVTYFRGEKKSEVTIPLALDDQDVLLVSADTSRVAIFNTQFGRVYLIDAATGTITSTLKVNNTSPILDATIADDGTIYYLTRDNSIWQLSF